MYIIERCCNPEFLTSATKIQTPLPALSRWSVSSFLRVNIFIRWLRSPVVVIAEAQIVGDEPTAADQIKSAKDQNPEEKQT